MTRSGQRILCIDVALPPVVAACFDVATVAGLDDARRRLAAGPAFDAIVLDGERHGQDEIDLAALCAGAACIAVIADADADADDAQSLAWLQRGADDVFGRDELASNAASASRRLRFAIERRRRDSDRQLAFSTDPGTGLPHRQQFVEHLSQLLALREREPSPMAVVVLRVEGLVAAEGGLAAEPLRRKLAVRLRAAVRASDVVAAIDADAFAVLLGAILAPGDAERVAEKLAQSLMAPVQVGGGERAVAVAMGIGRYPQDGKDAGRLLRRATALAAVAPASGRTGPAAAVDAAGAARVAANDDGA